MGEWIILILITMMIYGALMKEEQIMKYITVLDFEAGRVFQYEFLEHWEENEDSENIEWYLSEVKNHNLSNCEWMVHGNNEIITN